MDEMVKRACALYRKNARAEGAEPAQPSEAASGVEDGFVVLRNVNGELARFRIDGDSLRTVATEGV